MSDESYSNKIDQLVHLSNSQESKVETLIDEIIQDFTGFSKCDSLYKIPLNLLTCIVQKIDFNSYSNNIQTLLNFISQVVKYYGKESIFLLTSINMSNPMAFTFDFYYQILSLFSYSQFCVNFSKIFNQLCNEKSKVEQELQKFISSKNYPQESSKEANSNSNYYEDEDESKSQNKDNYSLFDACQYGKLYIVKQYIEHNHDHLSEKDYEDNTLLHLSCSSSSLDTVKYLCTQNINKESINNKGRTPFHISCLTGQLNIVKYLVDEEHVDTQIKDYDGYTGFHLACDSGFLDIVEYLGHKPFTDIESHEINGKTPMFTACDRGQISVVKYLIETLHACKDVRNMYDNNALHVASINGNLPLVKYFIEDLHFDPHIRGNENKTLIHLACVDDRYDVIKYLVEEKHLDVDDADDLGKTGLHRAAFFGHYRLVEYFLKHNCNYMLKDKEGKTALHYACMYKRIPVINILLHQLKHFDDLPRDNDGKTPIHTAAQNGNLEGLKYLLETEHLDSEIKDFQGKTPLHVACQAGRSNIVNYLCSSKLSNINALDFLGNTPLILSCQSQNLEILKILIQFKANTEIINADNNTALFYAKQGGNKELITILQENILA